MKLGALILTVFTAAFVAAAPAAAEWGPPSLLTVSPREQADGVNSSVLSADGRYLAFAGSLDGITGILRRDLQNGAIESVAAADAYGSAPIRDAANPSISADGRYVSFTTASALDPANDQNDEPDVYVRDMEASVPPEGGPCAIAGPCAYALASATDGATTGLAYTGSGGSAAAPRQALSADGRHVVFLVKAGSDLIGPGTPAGQVAVRDLDTQRTTLVSSTRDPVSGQMTGEPVPGGAASEPVAGGFFNAYPFPVLSADGSSVAWSGVNISLQAPTVVGDPAAGSGYGEPLWRRIGDGASAPTRRIVGAGDSEAPGCPPGGTIEEDACQGPYPSLGLNDDPEHSFQGGWEVSGGSQPAISADGWTVALTGTPPLHNTDVTRTSDLFVVDMQPGLSRRQAVHRLTQQRDTGPGINFESRDSIGDVAISANGRRIAFVTARDVFSLPKPVLVGPAPLRGSGNELWLADLTAQTLRRLSITVDGTPSSGDNLSPSFDAGGDALAFDSTSSNLVAVDANGVSDAFLVRNGSVPAGSPGRVDISPPPRAVGVHRAWRLALRAVARPDGSVRFDASCPGAGALRVTLTATVPTWREVEVRTPSGAHRTARRRVLAPERVASASLKVRAAGLSKLSVRADRPYRSLVRGSGGLQATAKVTFAARGHAKLSETLAVRLRRTGR